MRRLVDMMVAAAMLLPGSAQAEAVASLPADGKLVYTRTTDKGCELKLWDAQDRKERTLTALTECPKGISVTSGGKALLLMDEADVRVFSMPDLKLGAPITLPSIAVPKDVSGVGPTLGGYTLDGALALEMVADNRDDSQERYLFIRSGNNWTQAEQVHCGELEPDCSFKQKFDARVLGGVWGTLGPSEIWNDALRGDPYVVKRIPDTSETSNAAFDGVNTVVFHVYGRYSKLVFRERPGEDTDGTYTFGLKLVTPDNRAIKITDHQFDATIVGHYLLFYGFFESGTRLYDLGNGEVVLDHLDIVGWLP